MISGHIKIKIAGITKRVFVTDVYNCKNYECFHPHDCPVHAAKGVNATKERWMCLTNVLTGCPDTKKNIK